MQLVGEKSGLRFMRPVPPMLIATAAILTIMTVMPAVAAQGCGNASYASERSKLERLLIARTYPKAERSFLLSGTDRRVRELPRGKLNERGRQCGIDVARAHVLGCLAASLPHTPSPDRKTGKALWGKSNVSEREAGFIGIFYACRGGAMEMFFKVRG